MRLGDGSNPPQPARIGSPPCTRSHQGPFTRPNYFQFASNISYFALDLLIGDLLHNGVSNDIRSPLVTGGDKNKGGHMDSLRALRLKLERDVKEFNALKNNSRFGLLLSVLSPSHVLPCKYCGD